MKARTWGLCQTFASLICMTCLLGETPVSSLQSVTGTHLKVGISLQRFPEASAMRKTVFHVSNLYDAWLRGLKHGFADKTKARFHSGKWRCLWPCSQYCEVVTLVRDCDLLPSQKWHEGCWLLPFGSQRWLKWPNVCLYEGGVDNLRLHSQRTRVDLYVGRRTNQRKFSI